MNGTLYDLILHRVFDDPALDERVAERVLAACEGAEALRGLLAGEARERPQTRPPDTAERPGVYLSHIEVAGFRGIGPARRLGVKPGPGLTVIVGRNGSGKSSFAEGLEFLLTRENHRWKAPRPKVWRDGWRNLHEPDSAFLRAEFLLEGERGPTRAWMEWEPGAPLESAEAVVQPPGGRPRSLRELGWDGPLENYRPFLSYSELGTALVNEPSKFYDSLSNILGLGDLVVAEKVLKEEGAARKQADKEAAARLKERLLPQLDASADERAKACQAALKRRPWKLDVVEQQVARAAEPGTVSALTSAEPPDLARIQEVATALRAASARVAELSGTDAGRALQTAELLEAALQLHRAHDTADCPVCRTPAVLTPSWRASTEAEVQRLRQLTAEARVAREALHDTLREARALQGPDFEPLLQDGAPAAEQARLWRAGFPGTEATLAEHLAVRAEPYTAALLEAIGAARAEQDRRESEWRGLSAQLAAWLEVARAAEAAAGEVDLLAQAEKWLKEAQAELRDQRFEPLGGAARQNWEELRCDSNVELGEVRLTGAATQRRVALDVTVDGVGGAALSVMSQGELNALALSLFLPRATLPESPFRFLLIDDPVQAMDPARVDGLARVLERTARTRQILVFTHDNRLPESIRRLGIAADIVEVTRRPRSRIDLRPVLDPARRCLDDALSLALTEGLDHKVAASVVPGFCREAVEAVLTEQVRRRRLARGERHVDVEALLEQCNSLRKLAALALCDDPTRVADANQLIAQKGAGEIFRELNRGAHQGSDGDLVGLVRRAERLVEVLGAG